MKYLSKKKTLLLLITTTIVTSIIYYLPNALENMTLQKVVTISYLVIGTLLGGAFFLVNGASTAVIDGEYEKKFYNSVKEGKAKDEGENLHWNPLKLTLVKRIYYSKLLLCFLFPILAMFFIEYVTILISHL